MSLILNGTDGLSDVDGTAATPAIRGTDANTGIFFPAADTIAFSEGGTEAMRIDGSGNLGIGTSSPAAPIDVVANSSAIGLSIRGRSDNVGVVRWMSNDGTTVNGRIQVNSGGDMIFQNTNSITERMRIDSSGNVLIGTTSNSVGAVSCKFGLVGDFSGSFGQSINSSTGATAYHINFGLSGTQTGYISSTSGGTTYTTTSDYRLKENIMPMTGALDKVVLLKPVTYKWKENNLDGQGFIAHELAEVCPQAVSGEKDAVNEDGSIKAQGIDTSFLVATLTAALQELKAIVDAQAIEIAELKAK